MAQGQAAGQATQARGLLPPWQEGGALMGRHCVWWLQGERFADPLGRYLGGIVFTWAAPRAQWRDGRTFMLTYCACDACDPPQEWQTFQRQWDLMVAAKNYWLRDRHGNRVQGYGAARFATDMTKPGFVQDLCDLEHTWMSANTWCQGIYHDGLFSKMPWPVATVNPEAWEQAALRIGQHERAMRWRKGLNAGKYWVTSQELMDCFDTWKLEGFRPYFYSDPNGRPYFWGHGWTGPTEDPYRWRDWNEGRPGWLAGNLPSSHGHTAVLEAVYEAGWPAEQIANYYRVANGTMLLGDGMLMARHRAIPGHEDWSHHPYWDSSFEWARLLGEPVRAACCCDRARVLWLRKYQHGVVIVNATLTNAFLARHMVHPHDAAVVLDPGLVADSGEVVGEVRFDEVDAGAPTA
jgi:hypothetical protein